jgi:hypothetical protein
MAEKRVVLNLTGKYTSSVFKQPTRVTSLAEYVLYLTFPQQNEAKCGFSTCPEIGCPPHAGQKLLPQILPNHFHNIWYS